MPKTEKVEKVAELKGRIEAGLAKAEMSQAAFMFDALQSRFLSLLVAYREKLPGEVPQAEPEAAQEEPAEQAESEQESTEQAESEQEPAEQAESEQEPTDDA